MALGPAEVAHGPFLIGTLFNVLLYGVMIAQTFLYFTTFKKDRIWLKLFVALLFCADTINVGFDAVYIYNSLVIHFDDIPFLAKADWVFGTDPAMTGIIGTLVQLFFAWRVKVLNRRSIYAVIAIVLLAICSCLCSIGTSIAISMVPNFTEFQRFKIVVIVWLVCSALCDVIITFALVWHLRRHKTGFSATDDIVNRIIRATVQTGLLTAIWASVDLVVFLVNPTGLHLVFNVPLSKLYTNSLLSSMNARGGWQASSSNRTPSGVDSRSHQAHEYPTRGTDVVKLPGTNTGPEVFVHVEQHEMSDAPGDRKAGDSMFADHVSAQESDSEWADVKKHPGRDNMV
ncbi:hypothetical protein PLICRDRAFT_179929 [Plicaturopsis crispa FD-325 SS-3]|uniref:DUF6534 domain-containing protein n=1 Tax=Plicaturopsis crispa FD-325 SS-3 TaxID=944288 RepID=A0A0C9SWS3_PLICR|nr:hypothetical protein PLICRDRAFT_179929 [Plicaturopsis crispa FD-325 SS-3]